MTPLICFLVGCVLLTIASRSSGDFESGAFIGQAIAYVAGVCLIAIALITFVHR